MALAMRRRGWHEQEETQQLPPGQPPPKRKRPRWWLYAVVLMLVAVLWLLPGLVAHTPLLDWVLAKAAADLEGTLTVRSASLGWLSPIRAEGVEVRDADHKPLLKADRLTGDRPLAALLWDLSKLGQFQLDGPKLTVVLRDDGSNVEDVLAKYLSSTRQSKPVDLTLKVADGSASITDQSTGHTWQVEKLELSLSTSAEAGGPLKLEASGTFSDPGHPGRFVVALTMRQQEPKDEPPAGDSPSDQPPEEETPTSAGELTVDADAVPLAMFRSLIGRFAPQTRLAGRLSSKINAQWGQQTHGKLAVEADVAADDLAMAAPVLRTDQLRLTHLEGSCRIAYGNNRLEIERSSLDCDLGNASLTSTLDLSDRKNRPLLSSLWEQTHEIHADLDLARLAQVLPATLRIRQHTQITSGQVELAFRSRPNPQGSSPEAMIWQGRLEAKDLTAVYGERKLAWDRPILLALSAYQSQLGPVVESLKCESDFLKLHAAGTPDDLAASASFDLKRLGDQLGQFVDLGGLALGGDGWAQLNWKRRESEQFEADAQLQVRDFRLATPRREPWVEEQLVVSLAAAGRTDFAASTQIETASLQAQTGADRIDARLTRPVLDFQSGGSWPVELQMHGQLQNWPPRLATWIAMGGYRVEGGYQLDVQATGSTDGISVRRARLVVDALRLATPQINLSEPNVELVLTGQWHRQGRRLQIEPLTLTSSSLAMQANNLVAAMPDQGPIELSGLVTYRGELERLQQWLADPKTPRKWHIAGQLAGNAQLEQSGGVIRGQVEAEVGNLTVTTSSGERLHEPQVLLAARGDYEHRARLLRLERVKLSSGTLGADAAGQIARPEKQTELQLSGRIDYDLEKLGTLLRPYIGSEIRLAGRGSSPASFRGPLSPALARAEAGLSWDWAKAYGFQVGAGELKANLAEGMLDVQPLDLAVNRGRLLLAPRVRLAPQPMELTLPPGPVAKQVQITPQMCASSLKYIAPVLAEVAEVQGTFSIELDGCRIPLADPAKGEMAGRFLVHSIEVGPGPLIRELAVLLGRAAPAKLRRESAVDFRMVKGRVYHQGLELIFPELTIRTHGSVGLDQTLAIMAEMPVPPKWLGNNVVGSALRKRTIRLPIGGTLNKPQLDRREMQRLTREFLRDAVRDAGDAARDVLEEELRKQLERLFGPPR